MEVEESIANLLVVAGRVASDRDRFRGTLQTVRHLAVQGANYKEWPTEAQAMVATIRGLCDGALQHQDEPTRPNDGRTMFMGEESPSFKVRS